MHQEDENNPENAQPYTLEDLMFVNEMLEHRAQGIRELYQMTSYMQLDGVQLNSLEQVTKGLNICQAALSEISIWYNESLFDKYKGETVEWQPKQ